MSEICPKAVKLIRADVFRFTLEADYRARDSRRNFHAAKHLGSRGVRHRGENNSICAGEASPSRDG
jgi:hypothetical protein